MISGNNGVLTKATEAKENSEQASENEQIQLDELEAVIEDVQGETLRSKITAANYGDIVSYSANGITDWEIFYNSGSNVFLITSEYLLANKINLSAAVLNKTGEYLVTWDNSKLTGIQNVEYGDLFLLTRYTLNNNNNNSRCASTLLNTNNWTNFVDTDFANFAIGSPTIEMWLKSWNEKYTNDKRYCPIGPDGYRCGYSESAKGGVTPLENEDGLVDPLYFPHPGDTPWNGSYGYWLASPSNYAVVYKMYVDCRGVVGAHDNTYRTSRSLRPIVCIKPTVKGTSNTIDGVTTWTLSE